MAEWRECPFAGAPVSWEDINDVRTMFERLCLLYRRTAPIAHTPQVLRSDCATCRVPALEEAVDKARIHCGWLLSEYQEGGKPADIVESTRVVYEACTAALEQAKGEEHHG